MSKIEGRIRQSARMRNVVVSHHASGRIAKRNRLVKDIAGGAEAGEVTGDHANYHAGPALLMLQRDGNGGTIHVVSRIEPGPIKSDTARRHRRIAG